jgi:PqqA peptide cyclase
LSRSIVWEITARCNLQCQHCYNVWNAPGMEMPSDLDTADAFRLLANIQCAREVLKSLTFSGGEPLLRNDLLAIIAETRRLLPKVQLTIATNGQRLSLEMARDLKTSGVQTVQFTLLSACPGVHDRMMGGLGAFNQTMQAITFAKRAGLLVAVFFVATRTNIADFPGTAKLAVALGADAVVFNRFQPGGRSLATWQNFTPSPQQLEDAMRRFGELRSTVDVSMGTLIPPCEVPFLVEPRRPQGCPIGTAYAYPTIGPNGSLRPCNHTPLTSGSLLESPLTELLKSPCMRRPLPERLPVECVDCRFRKTCQGGCLAARELVGKPIYNRNGRS